LAYEKKEVAVVKSQDGIRKLIYAHKGTVELVYKFQVSARLRRRMRFVAIAREVFGSRFKDLWNQAFVREVGR
jgi:hypothetical protein